MPSRLLRRLVPSVSREALLVALVVAATTLAATVAYDVRIGSFNDDAVYVSLGRALSEGRGYRSIHLAGAPVHEKFPPGLPAILAVLWRIGGSLAAVQTLAVTLGILVSATAAALLYVHARRTLALSPLLVTAFVIVPFLLDPAMQFFTIIIAESWFVLAWAAVLLVESRLAADAATPPRARVALAGALGLLLAAATLMRTQGVLVAAATLGVMALRHHGRRWRETLVCAAAAVVPLAAWHWYHLRAIAIGPVSTVADESYSRFVGGGVLALLRSAPAAIEANAAFYATHLTPVLSRVPLIGALLGVLVLVLTSVGLRRAGRERPALALALLSNILVVLVWPYSQDRFVFTLLPFMGLVMAMGVRDLLGRMPRRVALVAAAIGALCTAVVLENQLAVHRSATAARSTGVKPIVRSPDFYLPATSDGVDVIARWVTTHTQPDERILSWYPGALFFYAGRPGVQSSPAENIARAPAYVNTGRSLAASIIEHRATVLVLESTYTPAIREIAGLRKACPTSLRLEARLGHRSLPAVYRMSPDDACLGALAAGRRTPGPRA